MHRAPERLVTRLRSLGFRGSGQNVRKTDGDLLLVVNFQGSRSDPRFFINLSAQPTFIPTEGNTAVDPAKVKEYDCIFRKRVRGGSWPWDITGDETAVLEQELIAQLQEFVTPIKTLRTSLERGEAERLITELPWGVPPARAALHLARGCHALGDTQQAARIAQHGLALASEQATILRRDLQPFLTGSAS